MAAPSRVVDGWLTRGTEKTAVRVRYASRYSVWVQAPDGSLDAPDGTEGSLVLSLTDKTVDLGACRSFAENGGNGRVKRFVPLDRIHDFEKLFSSSRVQLIESSLLNLPLILGHKESIDPAFRDFVSDLTYDLNVYKNLLDRLDAGCRGEPVRVREHVQSRLLSTVGRDLTAYLQEAERRLMQVVAKFSESEHEHHGFYFRKQMWSFLLSAPIIERTNLKPRGYSGDSEMMRMIYDNGYAGQSTFGRVLHKYAVEHPAAQAVRNRRRVVADMVRQHLSRRRRASGGRTRILSVACGPARELENVLRSARDCEKIHISLLDQDEQALMEAGNVVGSIETRFATKLSVDFIRESVRTMLFTKQLRGRWGKFDFIYSMGLFDYLTPPVAKAVIGKLYSLLNVGGKMVIGNFSDRNPTRTFMEYWLDWRIIHRSREELTDLQSNLSDACADVSFDETGIQMLLEVAKRAGDGEE